MASVVAQTLPAITQAASGYIWFEEILDFLVWEVKEDELIWEAREEVWIREVPDAKLV